MSASFSLSAANSPQGSAPLPTRVLLINVCRGGRPCPPFCPDSPNYRACGDTATVAPRAHSFLSCQKRMGRKEALGDASYCALTRANFWPLRGLNALFGRRIAIFPIAFNSDKCTTRICGQTEIMSLLLISGILGRLRFCTACCRGRCPHRPVGNHRIRRRFP